MRENNFTTPSQKPSSGKTTLPCHAFFSTPILRHEKISRFWPAKYRKEHKENSLSATKNVLTFFSAGASVGGLFVKTWILVLTQKILYYNLQLRLMLWNHCCTRVWPSCEEWRSQRAHTISQRHARKAMKIHRTWKLFFKGSCYEYFFTNRQLSLLPNVRTIRTDLTEQDFRVKMLVKVASMQHDIAQQIVTFEGRRLSLRFIKGNRCWRRSEMKSLSEHHTVIRT